MAILLHRLCPQLINVPTQNRQEIDNSKVDIYFEHSPVTYLVFIPKNEISKHHHKQELINNEFCHHWSSPVVSHKNIYIAISISQRL